VHECTTKASDESKKYSNNFIFLNCNNNIIKFITNSALILTYARYECNPWIIFVYCKRTNESKRTTCSVSKIGMEKAVGF